MRNLTMGLFLILFSFAVIAAPKDRNAKDSLKYFPSAKTVGIDLNVSDAEFLRRVARDTWKFFENSVYGRSGFVVDKLLVDKQNAAHYTSVTNIGLYMLCCMSAEQLGFISHSNAEKLIATAVENLGRFPKYKGFLYNWYELDLMKPADEYISTVDAGWLLSCLDIVSDAYPALSAKCRILMKDADFRVLYADSLGAFSLGEKKGTGLSQYHYELLCSESRISLYYAIKHGQLKPESYFRLKRTLPADIDQNQIPEGIWKRSKGIEYFNGWYTFDSLKFVPSWGGSAFEYLMPGLLFDERFAYNSLGLNNRRIVSLQIEYALKDLNYPVWGMSPCALPEAGYGEFGVSPVGTKRGGYPSGVVTPHASVLALSYDPGAVINNLKTMIRKYPVYGEFGFYDSILMDSGKVTYSYLALDQAMILISITNYLKDGYFPSLFMQGKHMTKLMKIIKSDRFFQ